MSLKHLPETDTHPPEGYYLQHIPANFQKNIMTSTLLKITSTLFLVESQQLQRPTEADLQ